MFSNRFSQPPYSRSQMIPQNLIDIAGKRFGLSPLRREFTLERVVRIAALACKAEFAAFSLTIEGHQLYFATFGSSIPSFSATATPCYRSPGNRDVLVIEDIRKEAHILTTRWMQDNLGMRAYAGLPIFGTDNSVIGTLCVMDSSPRPGFFDEHEAVLNDCARVVEDFIALRRDAVRDSLTGLYNRRFTDDQLHMEWGRAGRMPLPISILKVEIDQLDTIVSGDNHAAGDKVIAEAAILMGSCFRRAADTVSRYGGTQFSAILPSTHFEGAGEAAEKVRATIEDAGVSTHGVDGVTVSVGFTTVADQSLIDRYSGPEMMRFADRALLLAKQSGGNCTRSALPDHTPFPR